MINHYKIMEQMLQEPECIAQSCGHSDWRVRYAAAVAMGETKDPRWLPHLYKLLVYENSLPLYTQPPVLGFENSYDDTRMAEQIVPIKELFDKEYPEDLRESWRCRGRVKQACLFAVNAIGSATTELIGMMHTYLQTPGEDYAIKASSAMALGTVGHSGSIPYLKMNLEVDEWCCQTEAKKAIARLSASN